MVWPWNGAGSPPRRYAPSLHIGGPNLPCPQRSDRTIKLPVPPKGYALPHGTCETCRRDTSGPPTDADFRSKGAVP
jgi:hypothetical protein